MEGEMYLLGRDLYADRETTAEPTSSLPEREEIGPREQAGPHLDEDIHRYFLLFGTSVQCVSDMYLRDPPRRSPI
jgi:hypothetical protein